jgi:D-3-phosphoglycerate dehydrogenase
MINGKLNCKVLVTPTSFGKGDSTLKIALERAVREVVYNPFDRPLTSAELIPLVGDIDGYIAGLDHIEERVVEEAKRLKVIARYGAGLDRVCLPAATKRGIVVTNTPGANSAAVAEMTLGLMLALGREICRADRETRAGGWPRISGIGLRGKTVGLVGFGAVGREVSSRLKGFDCRILMYDPAVDAKIAAGYGADSVPLDHLLASCDFVSLHATLLPETTGMVDAVFLSKMKHGSFLVNTARGELIDESALQSALEKGLIRGAALDCFRKEPPGADHPLFRMPQVLVTPHIASHTDEAVNAMGWMSLNDCLDVLRGGRSPHTVNPDVYEKR